MQIVAPVQPLLQSQPERVKFHRGSDHTLYTQAAMICCEKWRIQPAGLNALVSMTVLREEVI
jgi:hypothetical protein